MNPALIRRAIRRHTLMKDRPAYAELLSHASSRGDVWKVPQAEVARWWELRQSAQLTLSEAGQARVACALDGAVVEVDGEQLRVPPFDIEPTGGELSLLRLPTYDPQVADAEMLREALGHLGYGHVQRAAADAAPDLAAAALDPVVSSLRQQATVHQRFSEGDIDRLRQLLRRAHHHRGLPDLRLWPLPHAEGKPWRVALSVRYDVDAAIDNMDAIHRLEDQHGLRCTAYLRPVGCFYGKREIRAYARRAQGHELTLHGEFVTTAERMGTDESRAAAYEKQLLEDLTGQEAAGVCLHGGELRINTTRNSWRAVEAAGFRYDTMYRNDCYLPLHLPGDGGLRRTLSIGQHFADISVPLTEDFTQQLAKAFIDHLERAAKVGGVFVPVMHPLYFDVAGYLRGPRNLARLGLFLPVFLYRALRMRRDQVFVNQR